ncbi:MAG TPA: hypothetical protein VFP66_02140 [Candidatus Limnocylindrales bacterium]|nr:hypothetical protein [Candidatus Limnocylindrales bacterium]
MDRTDWWRHLDPVLTAPLLETWIPVGSPGFAGAEKAPWRRLLDERFTPNGWRFGHIVRGAIVPVSVAIREYEASYRRYLRDRPALVRFLATACGNVYDFDVTNVHDDDYEQPHTDMNHYQDLSVRRVMSELVDDPDWPDITDTPVEVVAMSDLGTGMTHEVPRARGFRGRHLLQIRDPLSPGYALNPAVVPVHDPTLITSLPVRTDWYHAEGCGHLSVEAFWQMSKVVEVRLDRFLELGDARVEPLAGL